MPGTVGLSFLLNCRWYSLRSNDAKKEWNARHQRKTLFLPRFSLCSRFHLPSSLKSPIPDTVLCGLAKEQYFLRSRELLAFIKTLRSRGNEAKR